MQDNILSSTAAPEIIDDLRFDPTLSVTENGWVLVSDRNMGATSGTLKKKLGLAVTSTKNAQRGHVVQLS